MADGLLTSDTVLVTGGASGIGRGVATAFAREGARVVLADVEAARGEDVAAAIRAAGGDARFVTADLSTRDGPAALLAQRWRRSARSRSSSTARVRGASRPTPSSR